MTENVLGGRFTDGDLELVEPVGGPLPTIKLTTGEAPVYPAEDALTAAAEDEVVDVEEPVEVLDTPTHAGLAVQALDTGRVLMLQRALDPEDPAAGKWEFPGGSIDDGETPLEGACREWTEETGMVCPDGEPVGGWVSPDGVYEAFVFHVPTESSLALNPDVHQGDGNPDDPDRDMPEVCAWLSREDVEAMGDAIRQEVREGTDWTQFVPTVMIPVAAALTAGADLEALGALTAAPAVEDEEVLPEDMPVPDGAPSTADEIDPDGEPFYGIIAPEGIESDDGRAFGPDSFTTRELPIPLMFQDAQEEGHDGAVRVGRIDEVWRDTETYDVAMIRFRGVWDTSENAVEAQRQVDKGVARGVSVDGVKVVSHLEDSAGNPIDPLAETAPEDGVVVQVADEVKSAGLTICSVPAFEQTYIANGVYEDRTEPEPGQAGAVPLPSGGPSGPSAGETPTEEPREPVAASAAPLDRAPAWSLVASAGDEHAWSTWVLPAAHFQDPGLEAPTSLTVDPDGRVYGHLATWGQCHLSGAPGKRGDEVKAAGKCMEVPDSPSGYAYFATGVVHTDDGGTVNVGQLTMNTGHASLRFNAGDTVQHYDHTGTQVADVAIGHDTIGIWFSGHLRPDATTAQVHALTAAGSVSGDWREVVRGSRQLELVAALVVNVPGYPIGRPRVANAAGGPVALVASGAVQPDARTTVTVSDDAVADLAARVMAHMKRTARAEAVRARAQGHRVAAAAARINRKG